MGCRKATVDPDIKFMEEIVANTMKQAPFAIDYMTVFDSCKILPDKTLGYYYTLRINLIKTDTAALKLVQKETAIYNFMNDSTLNPLKEKSIACRYVYKSPVGKTLLDFTINPDFYSTQQSSFQDTVSDKKMYEYLKATVDFMNPQLPREIGPDIILTKITTDYPRTIIYRCLLDGLKIKDVNFEGVNTDWIKSELIKNIRTDKSDGILKNNDVTFCYTYTDEDGVELYTIRITPEEYLAPPQKEKSEIRIAVEDWKNRSQEDDI